MTEREKLYFSKRLKQLREEAGMSQTALAAELPISRSQLGKYEARSKYPKDMTIIYEIAKFFEVSVGYMLGRTDYRGNEYKKTKEQCISKDELREILEQKMLKINQDYGDMDATYVIIELLEEICGEQYIRKGFGKDTKYLRIVAAEIVEAKGDKNGKD